MNINFSQANKFLVRLALSALGYGLLAYAASRTLEFVSETMPPDKQWMGYLYLLATGVGAIIWGNVFLHDAKGAKRRGVSFAMAVVDLLAEFVLVYADTMRESSTRGLLVFTAEELRLFILASVAVVGINALAWFFYKLWDPEKEQQRIAEDLADEIETETLKMISTPETRKRMIAEHAPHIQTAIMKRVTDSITSRFTEAIPADPRMPIIPADPTRYEANVPHPTQKVLHQERILWDRGNDPAAYYEPGSEYALPCGHTGGESWNKVKQVHECNVCGAVRKEEQAAKDKDEAAQPKSPFRGAPSE